MKRDREEIDCAVYMLFKRTHDVSMLNPYFMFDGNTFTMPEAINYIIPRAEKEIEACPGKDLREKGKYWSWGSYCNDIEPEEVDPKLSRALQMEDVPVEWDPVLRAGETMKHGLLPAQVFFMKAAHEYYILHNFMQNQFRTLQETNFDVDKIMRLMRCSALKWNRFEQTASGFRELQRLAHDEVVAKIFGRG